MACLVRIIQVNVDFVINCYCRLAALSFEGARNTTPALQVSFG